MDFSLIVALALSATSVVFASSLLPAEPKGCVCMPFYLCYDGNPNIYGGGIIEDRLGGKLCKDITQICCNVSDATPATTPPPRKSCGTSGFLFDERITKGNYTGFAEFPWMILIARSMPDRSVARCGGSLIHPRVVLTAAHCTRRTNQTGIFSVRAGEWDIKSTDEPYPFQDRDVEKVVLHERFDSRSLLYDFALLILKEPFAAAENVGLACLPRPSDRFDYAKCVVTGWGKDKYGEHGELQNILKKTEMPVVPRDRCESSLRSTRLGRFFVLHHSFICAGGEPGVDACLGDGGGPLVCLLSGSQDRYVQAGIVSWGIGCGGNRVPGAYADVAVARRWIDEKMAENGIRFDESWGVNEQY